MRKIVSGFFISLDGVVESPDKWHFPYFNDEMGAVIGSGMATSDAMMMGRNLYEEWSQYWPNATEDQDFAAHINGIEKFVVSTTLKSADWQNTTLLDGSDLTAQITEIKSRPGKNIYANGSPTLVRSLLALGLVDELQLLIHPIIVGTGARLYDGLADIPLKLESAETFSTGVVYARYVPGK
ncbi:dihydrofolate reductase family protein [Acrocarpospora catenulata]|uniref:dihydrofolate reductase family protein n=1 Tax=Acrocarpospora catenulata TaxID=2836182 RepID=UPI001BDB5DDB|nr:dihydrofolate reductase family protein [Acrocarpospora catenulata]